MSKIYTKTGDDGTTGLFGSEGTRLKKYHIQVETYGTVDELNSYIGLISNLSPNETLLTIQRKLFNISSQLAMDNSTISIKEKEKLLIENDDILLLENEMDKMNEILPELKEFIIPVSYNISSCHCHVARTICRRCERKIVKLSEHNNIDKNVLIYINRLSDYLFVLARYENIGYVEVKWKPKN